MRILLKKSLVLSAIKDLNTKTVNLQIKMVKLAALLGGEGEGGM